MAPGSQISLVLVSASLRTETSFSQAGSQTWPKAAMGAFPACPPENTECIFSAVLVRKSLRKNSALAWAGYPWGSVNNLCGQGRELCGAGQASALHSPLGGGVKGNNGGEGNVLADRYRGAGVGEKLVLRGRGGPLLKRKSKGQNQHVQCALS